MAAKPYVIAQEEHYQDAELRRQTGGPGMPSIEERLDDVGALRLREMDESGVDFQVLSHSIPGLQGVDAATGVPLARRVNDRLNEAVHAGTTLVDGNRQILWRRLGGVGLGVARHRVRRRRGLEGTGLVRHRIVGQRWSSPQQQ